MLGIPVGWRTVALNLGIAALTAVLSKAAGINWAEMVGPSWSVAVMAAINIGMRIITTTPVGVKS